jgi:hypothetical protein
MPTLAVTLTSGRIQAVNKNMGRSSPELLLTTLERRADARPLNRAGVALPRARA